MLRAKNANYNLDKINKYERIKMSDLNKQNYSHGAIIRIKLENFV